jgi:polyisoprenoid-binding protein YceI
MQATYEPMTEPELQALLKEGTLAGEWVLDPRRSSMEVTTWHLWHLAPVHGVFREASGNTTVSPNGQVTGTLTVAAASITTGNPRRDRHLRSKAFLDSDTYPDITYSVGGVWPSDEGITVTGSVTVRGRTHPLSFDAAVSAGDGREIRLDADVPIDRTDFGLTWNVLGIPSMNVVLRIHAVLTRRGNR